MDLYQIGLKLGDKIKITKDITAFNSNKILVKKDTICIYKGGSVDAGLFLPEGKKRNVKVYYDYVAKI